MRVRRVTSQASAAERARWLAELADALQQAQLLTWQIGLMRGDPRAMELYGRIDAALAEVEAAGLWRRQDEIEDGPEWSCLHPWSTGTSNRSG